MAEAEAPTALDRALLQAGNIFDEGYYRAHARLAPGVDALDHYLRDGWRRGLQPNPDFPGEAMQPCFEDVGLHGPAAVTCLTLAAAGTPLPRTRHELDQLTMRILETGLFDEGHYRASARLADPTIDAVTHYAVVGERLGLSPSAEFDPGYYGERNPDVLHAGMSPLIHYSSSGRAEQRLGRAAWVSHFRHGAHDPARQDVLLVVHETSRTGAPILGWNIARILGRRYNVFTVRMGDGELTPEFEALSSEVHGPFPGALRHPVDVERSLRILLDARRFAYAVVNSAESRLAVEACAARFIPTVLLMHEFGSYVNPVASLRDAFDWAGEIVFPAPVVQRAALDVHPILGARECRIIPQGMSVVPAGGTNDKPAPPAVLAWLDAARAAGDMVVLGAGSVHIRKGVDLFLDVAAAVRRAQPARPVRFLWIGGGYRPERDMEILRVPPRAGAALRPERHRDPDGRGVRPRAVLRRSGRLPAELAPGPAAQRVHRRRPARHPHRLLRRGERHRGPPARGRRDRLRRGALRGRRRRRRRGAGARGGRGAARAHVGRRARARRGAVRHGALRRAARCARPRHDARLQAAPAGRPDPGGGRGLRRGHGAGPAGGRGAARTHGRPVPGAGRRPRLVRAAGARYGVAPAGGGVQPARLGAAPPRRGTRDPFASFVRRGRPSGPWQLPVLHPQRDAPAAEPPRAALHAHLFYPELVHELLDRLGPDAPCDLLVSTDTPEKAERLERVLDGRTGGRVLVRVMPNRGRDLGPFLTGFREELAAYDVVGHVHGKRSLSAADAAMGESWRAFLWENLLGGQHAMLPRILDAFAAQPELGLVFAADPHLVGWDANRAHGERLAARMGLHEALPDAFDFPLGTMFWMRRECFAVLASLDIGWDEYPSEPLADDGTVLHALERLMPLVARRAGLGCAVTHVPGLSW